MDPSLTDPQSTAGWNPPEQLNNISPATNPPPSNGHNYPSYPEMISAAIGALREQEGSSRQAIAKYIEQVFTNLPPDNAGLLTHHLKWMKQAGQLVMFKHSYALPGSAPIGKESSDVVIHNPATATKRRPGRPPKPKSENHQLVVSSPDPIQESVFVSLGLVDEPIPLQDDSSAQPVLGKRGRGRPPKLKSLPFSTDLVDPIADLLSPTGHSKRKPGRPRKIDSIARILPTLAKKLPKPSGTPRGRPRKYVVLPTATIGEAQASVGVTPVKRRGRTKGSSLKKARRLSGKPLGRPRKTMLIGSGSVNQQQVPTNDDLLKRLEHIQEKIKQVVNVVKPHLGTTTTANALRSLQELEQLARQNVYAPFNIQVQLPILTSADALPSQEQQVIVQPSSSVPIADPNMFPVSYHQPFQGH